MLYVGIGLVVIIIAAFSAVFYLTQSNKPTLEALPIATPQYQTGSEKIVAYINISVKNNGNVNKTDVVVKLSGGFTNSSNEVPDQLFWIVTKRIDVIRPGETVTIPKIFNFGWYFFYRIEVSSSDGTREESNQWVKWRVWEVPIPTG